MQTQTLPDGRSSIRHCSLLGPPQLARGGAGQIDMQNNAQVATNGTYITPNGVITGTGTLAVGSLGLQNDGTLAPGINVLYPLAPATPSQAQGGAATMAISGTLNMGPTGQVAIPLVGNGAGQYGHLMITGTATLDGVLYSARP